MPDPVPVVPNDYVLDELEEFAAWALEGKTPEVDGRVALAPLTVVLAAIRSAEERSRFPLHPERAGASRFAAFLACREAQHR